MNLLNPTTLYRDTNVSGSAGAIDLAALMLPANIDTPSGWAITAGDPTGQWSITAGGIAAAGSGVTAGTYNLTVEATFPNYPSPYATSSQTLEIIVPPNSVYVDPAATDDTGAGTKLDPWKHAPGDPNATDNAASFAPTSETLVVIKGGNRIRSRLVPTNANLRYAGGESVAGWGVGATTYCGADQLGSASAPTSGEVFGNPNLANIKRWPLDAATEFSQYLIDRDNDTLVQWAQWPEAGPDPYLDAANPSADPVSGTTGPTTSGVYKIARSAVTFGAAGTLTMPSELVTFMGGSSLVGAYIGLWVSPNEFSYFPITADNGTTLTFDTTGYSEQGNDPTAFQIVGHPKLITGPGQWAWSPDRMTIYAWTVSASNIERMVRTRGVDASGVTTSGVGGLTFEGYYGATTASDGSGFSLARSSDFTMTVADSRYRWFVNGNLKSAAVRTSGAGNALNCKISGNRFEHCIRASAVRISNNFIGGEVLSNSVDTIARSGIYIFAPENARVSYNSMSNVRSTHGNGFVFYNDTATAHHLEFNYNTAENVVRPLTKDEIHNFSAHGNLLEMDDLVKDGVRNYASVASETFTRCAFLRRRGVAGSGQDAYQGPPASSTYRIVVLTGVTGSFVAGETVNYSNDASGTVYHWGGTTLRLRALANLSPMPGPGDTVIGTTSGATGTVAYNLGKGILQNCVFDGVTGLPGPTYLDSLVAQLATNRLPIEANTPPDSGNQVASSTAVWDGTIKPQWKQFLGGGRLGDRLIYGIAVVNWPDLANQAVNTVVESAASQLTSDGAKSLTVTNGEARFADDVAMTVNVSAWASSHGAIANGKYVQLRQTTSTSNRTTTTTTADFGEGNVYTWRATTVRASGWPLISCKPGDDWRRPGATPLGAADTKEATLLIPLGAFATPASSAPCFGQFVGNNVFVISMLSTRRMRVSFRSNAGTQIVRFDTPTLPGTAVDVLVTIDTTKAVGATTTGALDTDGIQLFFDGVRQTVAILTEWEQDGLIGWTRTLSDGSTRLLGGETAVPNIFGGFFLWNTKGDTSTHAARDKFSPLQLGVGGFTNPLAVAPIMAFVGDESYWDADTLENRGSGLDFNKASGTDVSIASGGSPVWPAYTYASAVVITGPSDAPPGEPSAYTVSFADSLGAEVTVNLSDGGAGGAFDQPSLTFPPAVDPTPQTFQYTPVEQELMAFATGFTPGSIVINDG